MKVKVEEGIIDFKPFALPLEETSFKERDFPSRSVDSDLNWKKSDSNLF